MLPSLRRRRRRSLRTPAFSSMSQLRAATDRTGNGGMRCSMRTAPGETSVQKLVDASKHFSDPSGPAAKKGDSLGRDESRSSLYGPLPKPFSPGTIKSGHMSAEALRNGLKKRSTPGGHRHVSIPILLRHAN